MTASSEEHHVNDKRWRYENLQHNSRAAWLQGRWLEVSEQERRAQLHNQKLLQDFQRAQDTLDDMVARTEAMNTIRVQYERYLEDNFPRWQQKLKDIQVSEESKVLFIRCSIDKFEWVQKHLKNGVQPEDQGINAEYRSDTTPHTLSSKFPDRSQLPTSLPSIHHVDKDTRQNPARCNQSDHAYIPSTWLTDSQHIISALPQNNIPKDYKNFNNIQALSHNLPPCYSLPCDSPIPLLNPMDVPNLHVERTHCSETDQENIRKEILRPSKESNQRLKHKSKGKGREHDQPFELDCRPVRLLTDHENSSEGSALSSEVVNVPVSGMKEKRKKRRYRTESQSTANGRKSQSSSTVSQDSSGQADPQKSEKHQKPSTKSEQDNSKKNAITDNNTDAVKQDEDDEHEESRSQEITSSHVGSDKTDGTEVNQKNCGEEEDTGVDEGVGGKIEGTDEGEAGLDYGEGSEWNREETEHIYCRNIPDSDSEEGEIEKDHSHDELVKEARGSQEGMLKSAGKDKTESDERESEDNNDISKRNIQIANNSLKELYGNDETEEEDIDDDDDDGGDDEMKQSYLWTNHTLCDQTKSSDDDEDIENLLNPHVNSQTHQEDDVVETDQPNNLNSDSNVEDLPKRSVPAATNKPASDDEFDNFYD